MGSRGRIPFPPQHLRRPLPSGSASMLHPEMHPLPGPYSPFDMLPPPQVMEQKLASQHLEIQRLATENHRLAATHGTLRQELAAAQQELQMLDMQIGSTRAEGEQQLRDVADNIARMEAELKAAEPVKIELQKAHAEAQKLVVSREELFSKAQQLSQELQRTFAEVQQIPALVSELERLRQEYQHSRATFEYEKKIYSDHLESLQVMEKNYASMSRELEKLRAELTKTANVDQRNGPYGGIPGTNENEASGLPLGQNAYDQGYAVAQGRGPIPTAGGGSATKTAAGISPVPASASTGYNAPRGPVYDASAGFAYNAQRLTSYDAVIGSAYDAQRAAIFDAHRTTGYDLPKSQAGYEAQRGGQGYDASRAASYDAQARGAAGPYGHAPPVNNTAYGSTTPPARGVGGGYEVPPQGTNPLRR
ncbi:PREDICTED: protein FLX-like 2 isoform X2 [Lupinus angustifolius]|uniref:protein FLX-like 2 isoform X2 n=1 Tax=Lupinus angustifolius TaxID=3871 RepID=UPI00092E5A2B|nr:PREDICTED: protein FLX-like 2 isoform X2 [Lupinus angustifolius]